MRDPDPESSPLTGHVAALDGVRGFAIMMVMLGHFAAGFGPGNVADALVKKLMQTGWAGVDIFFVLSGFLITGILLEAKNKPRYFRNFYSRRALRIFPAYYAFLFIFFVAAPVVGAFSETGRYAEWHRSQWWFWGYVSNLQILFPSWSRPAPLSHFWSLAVEEQFYLFWPAVVLFTDRKWLVRICLAFLVCCVALRVWIQSLPIDPTAAYRLTPARLDTLGVGAMLAVLVREPGFWTRIRARAPVGLVLALVGVAVISIPDRSMEQNGFWMQAVGYTLLAFAGASLVVYAIDPAAQDKIVTRFLRSRFMRFLGKYSYAMYIIHFPLAWTMEDRGFGISMFPRLGTSAIPGTIAFTLIAGALTAVLAVLSWNLFETHFLRAKRFFPRLGEVA